MTRERGSSRFIEDLLMGLFLAGTVGAVVVSAIGARPIALAAIGALWAAGTLVAARRRRGRDPRRRA